MPTPKVRVRPRLSRMSASSSSSFKRRRSLNYIFLVVGALLLFASISLIQLRLGPSLDEGPLKFNSSEDNRLEEEALERELIRVNQEKDVSGVKVQKLEMTDFRRTGKGDRLEAVNQGLDDSDKRQAGILYDSKIGDEAEKEGDEESQSGEGGKVRSSADFSGRGTDVNDGEMDDFEFGDVGQNLNEVEGFATKGRGFQGQVLDEMDKFVTGQVMEDTTEVEADDDEVPEVSSLISAETDNVRGEAANKNDQKASKDIVYEQVREGTSPEDDNHDSKGENGVKLATEKPWTLGSRHEKVGDMLKMDSRYYEASNKFDEHSQAVDDKFSLESKNQFVNGSKRSIGSKSQREEEKREGAFFWDHALGVTKRSLEIAGTFIRPDLTNSNSIQTVTKVKRNEQEKVGKKEGEEVGIQQLQNSKGVAEGLRDRYNSDDELLDEDVQRQLEEVVEIEDALMLDKDSSPLGKSTSQKYQNKRPDGIFDPANVANNPMLQDPDTLPGSGMTKSDKAMLKAMRADDHNRVSLIKKRRLRGSDGQKSSQTANFHTMLPTDITVDNSSLLAQEDTNKVNNTSGWLQETGGIKELNSEDKSILTNKETAIPSKDEQLMTAGEAKKDMEFSEVEHLESTGGDLKVVQPLERTGETSADARQLKEEGQSLRKKATVKDDKDYETIQWGYYPTLSRKLKFSMFMSAFFKQDGCSLRIFMAWTTAPWAYTTRHQRAMESLLHFHPHACIVVYTETVNFKFFHDFVNEGYKIAVVRPNLEELLGHTPAIEFAYVWPEWRITDLFYIHYTELLRIASLYKYGGVWLDMDMILARPLPKLCNSVGSTTLENGEVVLNGAFMAFNKSSPFLKACIEEFTETYDEKLLGWNGADLLNRVATNATRKGRKTWLDEPDVLHVQDPFAFFPVSQHNITSYFYVPTDYQERLEHSILLTRILDQSYGIHLWNSLTVRLVPETGSLVESILNQYCMRCTDLL